jgi:hypothetical protein
VFRPLQRSPRRADDGTLLVVKPGVEVERGQDLSRPHSAKLLGNGSGHCEICKPQLASSRISSILARSRVVADGESGRYVTALIVWVASPRLPAPAQFCRLVRVLCLPVVRFSRSRIVHSFLAAQPGHGYYRAHNFSLSISHSFNLIWTRRR